MDFEEFIVGIKQLYTQYPGWKSHLSFSTVGKAYFSTSVLLKRGNNLVLINANTSNLMNSCSLSARRVLV